MELETKAQIAKATLIGLTALVYLFLLGVLVFVLCVGLQINPFKETTTSFLIAAFVGVIGIAAVLVLLNVATNISLIADAKIAELPVVPRRRLLRRWLFAFLVPAIVLVVLILGGTYLSKERFLAVVHHQADEVLNENRVLLNEISRLLASGKPEDYKRIFEIRTYLQNQRNDLPFLALIYSGKFENKTAFYGIASEYFPGDFEKKTYTPNYFRCTANRDCDFLKRFFSGEKVDVLEKYTIRDNQFYIYIPFEGKESRFVLSFSRGNEYGKIGS